jgi:hypothetical protein
MNAETCGKLLFTDRTDTFFVNEFSKTLERKDIWLHRQGKSEIINLQKSDKLKLLRELNTHTKSKWTDEKLFDNGKIIPFDSILHSQHFIDTACLFELTKSNKYIKIISFCKPIYLTGANSFVIYIIEIGILPKRSVLSSWSAQLILFERKQKKWTKKGYLYNGRGC